MSPSPLIYNAGSLNIDEVFSTHHIVRPGETISSRALSRYAGGKGLNQSIALARSGASVHHLGRIGVDGIFLKERLEADGVDVSGIIIGDAPTGYAIIQVADNGENAIVLFGGANTTWDSEDITRLLTGCKAGDILLAQNEINMMPELMTAAADAGMRLAMNPAPMDSRVASYPLDRLSWLIVNKIEGRELAGSALDDNSDEADEAVAIELHRRYSRATIIITLGKRGAIRVDETGLIRASFPDVGAVMDTTGAGDTFTGYWLAAETSGLSAADGLRRACAAGAIAVTRMGAAMAIPHAAEVDAVLKKYHAC